MMYLLVLVGLVLLFFGGELLVRGAVNIAERLGVSSLLIGLILVGFGTSTPELVTSILAIYENKPGIAVGNVVGSNIANILLILGVAALIYPVSCNKQAFKRDGSFMILAVLAALGVCVMGSMNMVLGGLFVLLLASYIGYSIYSERRAQQQKNVADGVVQRNISMPLILKDFGIFCVGLILTIIGAKTLVTGSIDLARGFGVSETIIGLTVVAVGTSMPELVASCIAAWKKQSDIAFGNIIGSNIYNILGILGITGLIHPFAVPEQIMDFDIWVMVGASFLLMIFAAWGWSISRVKGGVFLGLYCAYTIALIITAQG